MIYDSLRFTLEMAEYTYGQLRSQLESVSKGEETRTHYKAFHYAWSFIDHCERFVKLYKALNPPADSVITRLEYIQIFRNAIQHVDLNLDKTNVRMLDNGRPIYGALKWVVNDVQHEQIYTSLWISGIFNIKSIEFRQPDVSGYSDFINEIKLETDTLRKTDANEISLSALYRELEGVVQSIEETLLKVIKDNQIQMVDWKSTKDVILNMKSSPTTV